MTLGRRKNKKYKGKKKSTMMRVSINFKKKIKKAQEKTGKSYHDLTKELVDVEPFKKFMKSLELFEDF